MEGGGFKDEEGKKLDHKKDVLPIGLGRMGADGSQGALRLEKMGGAERGKKRMSQRGSINCGS